MPVVLNLDGNHPQCRVPNDCWRVFIDSEGREKIAGYWDLSYAPGPLDWKQLRRLKKLSHLHYEGSDATVMDFVTARGSGIQEFFWTESHRARFDFSQAKQLRELALEVSRKTLHLKLPAGGRLRCLRLFGAPTGCRATVICPNRGAALSLATGGDPFLSIPGLKQLSGLDLLKVREVDLARVARAYPQLKSLEINGAPVTLRNERALRRLTLLERLSIQECYAMDAEAFPLPADLPALQSVHFDGLRKADAEVIKSRYKAVDDLSIYGKRTDEWIANNLGNPFRMWEEDFGGAAGKRAIAAWKSARTAIGKLGKKPMRAKARTILRDFVGVFNQLDQKAGLETNQREQIFEAFTELAAQLPDGLVTEDDYYEWAEYA